MAKSASNEGLLQFILRVVWSRLLCCMWRHMVVHNDVMEIMMTFSCKFALNCSAIVASIKGYDCLHHFTMCKLRDTKLNTVLIFRNELWGAVKINFFLIVDVKKILKLLNWLLNFNFLMSILNFMKRCNDFLLNLGKDICYNYGLHIKK